MVFGNPSFEIKSIQNGWLGSKQLGSFDAFASETAQPRRRVTLRLEQRRPCFRCVNVTFDERHRRGPISASGSKLPRQNDHLFRHIV